MTKLRLLFVLFSLIVLAAPARAQRHEKDHDRDHGRRTTVHRDRDRDDDDERKAKDNDDRDDDDDADDDEDDDNGRIGSSTSRVLPEMVNAILISRGQLTRSGRNWLGGSSFTPRFSRSANEAPRQVTWVDRSGSVRQVWLDTNRDGRADVVKLYRSGKLVRTVRR